MEKVNASSAIPHFTPEEAALCIEFVEARIRLRRRARMMRAFNFNLLLPSRPIDDESANSVGEAWESVGDYLRLAILRRIAQNGGAK